MTVSVDTTKTGVGSLLTFPEASWVRASHSPGVLSLDLAASSDVPTITYPASSGWGASAIACTDSRFTYWGGVSIIPNTGAFGQMVSLSTSGENAQPFFWEFGFDGLTVVIRAGVDVNKTKWLLWVDGKLAKADADYYVATTGTRDITITFAAKKLGGRVLTFLGSWGAHKITPGAATDTVYQVTRSKGRRVALIGDSWGRTSSDFMDGVFYHLALSLGYSDIIPSMQGGTGYYNPGPAGDNRRNFSDRFAAEVAPAACTDFIVGGSINDLPSSLPGVARGDVQAKMAQLYALIFSSQPNARVYAFGTQYVRSTLTSTYDSQDAELRAAISGLPVTLVSTSGWFTGTGKVDALANDGNRDIYRAADGDHPASPDGVRYWAARVKQAFIAAGFY